jgi:pimeloyl-ACP methyl ester carboxylesterase
MLEAAEDLPAQAQRYVGLHAVLADVATHSRPGAPVLATRAPLPLILFSPGGNVSMHAQTALAERLASRGFVFAALSHAHSSLDVAPQTGFSMSMDWGLDQDDPVAARAADDRLAETLAGDVALVRARLAELREAGDPLAVALDLDAPVLAGHSRGGTTVGRVCAEVPEVDACIVLDNIGPDREQETGVAPPFLTLRSSWEPERVEQLHGYLGRTGSVAFDVEFEGSTHFSCTDLPLFIGDVRSPTVGAVAGIDACAAVIEAFLRASIAEGAGWLPAIGGQTLSATRFDAAPSLRSP